MREKLEKLAQNRIFFWSVFLFAMLLKYAYYGFSYLPVRDDNNMYGVYSIFKDNLFQHIILGFKLYTNRPVAGFLDAYFISRLWGNFWIVLITIVILHVLACWLLWKIFEMNNVHIGIVALIFVGMLPLGSEAAYWIPASSRLVVGLFFTLLSFYFLMLYIKRNESRAPHQVIYFVAFLITNLLSMGFYEQLVVFSFCCAVLLLAANFKRIRNRLVLAVPFVNAAAIGFLYKFFSNIGSVATRGHIVNGNYILHTRIILAKFVKLLAVKNFEMTLKGIPKGLQIIIEGRAYIYLAAAVLTAALFIVFSAGEKLETRFKSNAVKFILGGLLLVIPIGPFFILQSTWVCNRNAFPSLIGLGLMAEAVISLALDRKQCLRVLKGVIIGVLVFACITGNTAEVWGYQNVSMTDNKLTDEFIKAVGSIKPDADKKEFVLFNSKPLYVDLLDQHIWNCTGSDWSMSGAVFMKNRSIGTKNIQPAPDGTDVVFPRDRLLKAVYVGVDDNMKMFPLTGKMIDSKTLELDKEDGSVFGSVNIKGTNAFCYKSAR